uniref:Protein EDS1 n=1 Tax=Noccaea caerulescens TaxID=107243 RepID=A0A1J3CEG7_NOCCA
MESIQSRVESWIRDQRAKFLRVSWGPLQWRFRWPPWNGEDADQRIKIRREFEKRKKQIQDLCLALKSESVEDLQDLLCCMVLSECVYKRPASEMVRAVNKFKADFGGQFISLERVQPSSDHVPHRYLLAEAGDTLFASFVGTKQYKDIMADANILQGHIFHDDVAEDECVAASEPLQNEPQKNNGEGLRSPLGSKAYQRRQKPIPAAHRGFLARAKGIPALELYRLAQKKKRKLVLCGHSLGGAVAALATLAILRVVAASSTKKGNGNVHVKCITFSQPPVGNAALRDYVHEKGWHHYFKSYCIPEDLVPRILSPAYFHHYNEQRMSMSGETEATDSSLSKKNGQGVTSEAEKTKGKEHEQLVIGVGPVQNSFWRLSRLVPLEAVKKQLDRYRGKQLDPAESSTANESVASAPIEDVVIEPQSLEIEEGSDGISLKPLPDTGNGQTNIARSEGKTDSSNGFGNSWRPSLPSYVPFGQLYLLGTASVESLSEGEYSKLTSVRSVITELRERLQSHSMKSYRSRFQRIHDLCMDIEGFFGVDQQKQFPHLQQWLGLAVGGSIELGHIVESPVIKTATSIAPLGWNGVPGDKNVEPLKVDITGFGLHLCSFVHAQVNGNWCSTTVESFPATPAYSSDNVEQTELQKIRVTIGAPLKRPPSNQIVEDPLVPMFSSVDSNTGLLKEGISLGFFQEDKFVRPEGLEDLYIFCTSDFTTVAKEVEVRTRRVRLLGLEGAGKTSLFRAILGQSMLSSMTHVENLQIQSDVQECIVGGVCYSDTVGVNLQELHLEASRFREELWNGVRNLSKKIDLIILVHNLSHRIPRYQNSSTQQQQQQEQQQPALALLLEEVKSLGIPWVLAITNKFSVSAHQQKSIIEAVLHAYQASPNTTGIVNSIPYVISTSGSSSLPWAAVNAGNDGSLGAQKLIFAPLDLVKKPFQRKDTVFPVDGVKSLCQLVHRVLQTQEEACFQEFARDRLLVELAKGRAVDGSQPKSSSMSAAAVGASLGAGLGLVLAVVMGAGSALRKP